MSQKFIFRLNRGDCTIPLVTPINVQNQILRTNRIIFPKFANNISRQNIVTFENETIDIQAGYYHTVAELLEEINSRDIIHVSQQGSLGRISIESEGCFITNELKVVLGMKSTKVAPGKTVGESRPDINNAVEIVYITSDIARPVFCNGSYQQLIGYISMNNNRFSVENLIDIQFQNGFTTVPVKDEINSVRFRVLNQLMEPVVFDGNIMVELEVLKEEIKEKF